MTNQMLSAHGFSAWVTVDGEPLPVYQHEITNMTCTAWIPSTAGQAFSVWWKDSSNSRIATSGHVFIDGSDVASAILRPGHDETIANKDDATLGDLGTIKVEISRVKLGGEVPFKGYEAEGRGPVHEQAKKLGAHCTTYGPSKRATGSRTVAVSTAPHDPHAPGPYVTFVFRYRSEDLLRANGVISSGMRKRHSPAIDDEVIEISDSESENTSERPAKKRARINPPSESPVPSGNAPSGQTGGVASQGSEAMDGAASVPPVDTDRVSESPHPDAETASDGLGLGTPSLLQSHKAASQIPEESQTQPDDYSQMGFGTPLGLMGDGNDEANTGTTNHSPSQVSGTEGDAPVYPLEESQTKNETLGSDQTMS